MGNMSTFLEVFISMLYYFRKVHRETSAVSRKSMQRATPCTLSGGCEYSKILAGNKTMLIIPDLTL